MSESSSVVLKNLKEIIQEQEENIRKAIGRQFDRISRSDHVSSFNDSDDFTPDDRSTPVHHSVETSSDLPPIPESTETERNDSTQAVDRVDSPVEPERETMDRVLVNLEDSPVEPGTQTVNLEDSPVRPAKEAVRPAKEAVKPAKEAVKPAKEAVKPAKEAVKPAKEAVDLEDSPVKPGVDGCHVKSFEELLELSMRNESQIAPDPSVKKPVVKRVFLKKGEGIEARFRPKQILKKTCHLEKQSQTKDPHSTPSESPKKPMSTKAVNVLPRTDTRGRPVAKETATVTGNLFSLKKERETATVAGNLFSLKKETAMKRETATVAGNLFSLRKERETATVAGNLFSLKKSPGIQQVRKVSRVSDTSLDNLERLLVSVRSRKEELLRQPLSSDPSSPSSEEEEEDSCWEEEEEESEESDPEERGKKRVRWNDMSSKISTAKAGVYTRSVRNYMVSLEKKLLELQERCALKERKERVKEERQVRSVEVKEDVGKEIADLRSQIGLIADGIRTLQLYTSSLKASGEGKKNASGEVRKNVSGEVRKNVSEVRKNTSGEVEKRPMNQPTVRVTREFPVRERSVKSIPDNDPRFDEDANVKFGNGDQMQVLKDGTVIYTFSDGTLQTTFPDGSKVVQFKNGQIERTLVNGLKQITYPNKCQRTINPDGSEELIMFDGTITRIAVDGTEVVILPSGEREIRSKQYSRREYKNGCVKTIYADGTQETRFPNGRIRIKDKNDKVLVDSVVRPLTQL